MIRINTDMPQNCAGCPFMMNKQHHRCGVTMMDLNRSKRPRYIPIGEEGKRQKWCPLEEVEE